MDKKSIVSIATAIYKFFCDAVNNSEIVTICCNFRTPLQWNNKFPFISPHAMLYSPILARLSQFERIALAQRSDVKSFQSPKLETPPQNLGSQPNFIVSLLAEANNFTYAGKKNSLDAAPIIFQRSFQGVCNPAG